MDVFFFYCLVAISKKKLLLVIRLGSYRDLLKKVKAMAIVAMAPTTAAPM